MNSGAFENVLTNGPIMVIGIVLFVVMCVAAAVGNFLRRRRLEAEQAAKGDKSDKEDESGQEGYIVSAVLGLLALLLGFTFSLAVDRFETRRGLVLEEANAIGTAYLRAQLLTEPHRARMSGLLVRYTDNRIALARAKPGETGHLLAANDALLTDIWAATSAAFETIKGLDFSSTYVDSVNHLIDLDTSRKAARLARVPPEVFAVLFVYLIITAAVLGYVLKGRRGWISAIFLMALLTLSLMLIIDIDRPVQGGIMESQRPMEILRASMTTKPTAAYDKWKTPAPP